MAGREERDRSRSTPRRDRYVTRLVTGPPMERHYFPRELRALRVPGMQLTGEADRIPRPATDRIQHDDNEVGK